MARPALGFWVGLLYANVVVLLLCHLATAQVLTPSITYQNTRTVSPDMRFHWNVVGTGSSKSVDFALEFNTVSGWMGFGIGEPASGSMGGADIMVGFVPSDGSAAVINDYYATTTAQPILDCVQDKAWRSRGYSRNSTTTLLEVSRAWIATDRTQDRSFADFEATKLLFAFGSGQSFSYHGSNRVHTSINLQDASGDDARLAKLAAMPNIKYIDLVVPDNYVIPSDVTTYELTPCVTVPTGTAFVVAMARIGPAANVPRIHHCVVKGYRLSDKCQALSIDFWAVTSGKPPFFLPADSGINLGYFFSLQVEMHYDNPQQLSGIRDSSGVRIYYSTVPLTNEVGILQLGDPVLALNDRQLPSNGLSLYTFPCTSDCTSDWDSRGITVFASLLHMHKHGRRMETIAYNSSLKKVWEVNVEYYDFGFQDTVVFDPVHFDPGTTFITRCTYDTTSLSAPVTFGLGSSNEMCINFMYYYPLQRGSASSMCGLASCGTMTDNAKRLTSTSDLRTVFGGNTTCCPSGSLCSENNDVWSSVLATPAPLTQRPSATTRVPTSATTSSGHQKTLSEASTLLFLLSIVFLL